MLPDNRQFFQSELGELGFALPSFLSAAGSEIKSGFSALPGLAKDVGSAIVNAAKKVPWTDVISTSLNVAQNVVFPYLTAKEQVKAVRSVAQAQVERAKAEAELIRLQQAPPVIIEEPEEKVKVVERIITTPAKAEMIQIDPKHLLLASGLLLILITARSRD